MRRPLTLAGFCCLLTLAAAVRFGRRISFILFFVCAAAFAVSLFFKRARRAYVFPLAFFTAAAAFLSFSLYSRFYVEPPRLLDGKDLASAGTVCELPCKQNGRWYYVVKIDRIDYKGAPVNFKVRLSSQKQLTDEPYSRITGKMHFFMPSGGSGYSSRSYYASKGIMMFAYINGYEGVKTEPPPRSKPLYYYALKLRSALLDSSDDILAPTEAQVLKGVLLGDTSSLDAQTVEDFRAVGISHILSVSGFHMAALVQLISVLLIFFKVPKRASAVVSCAGVAVFMAVTCFVPSVTRSGVMCLLCVSAPLFSRRADSLNSLGASVLLICAVNPYAAADVGLLLSFSAVLGLILCTGKFENYLNARLDRINCISRAVRFINSTLATSFAAMLFTLPVILLSFGTFSLIAPVSNILEILPSSVMMMAGAVAALLNLAAPRSLLALPFAVASGALAKYMRRCAALLAKVPFASISVPAGLAALWMASALVIFSAAALLSGGKRLFKPAAWLSVIVLFTGVFSRMVAMRSATRIAVLDTGTAESLVITKGGRAAVVGCGGYNASAAVNYLNTQGCRRLDYIQPLTDGREERVNLGDLAERFAPGNITVRSGSVYDGFVRKAAGFSKGMSVYNGHASARLWNSVEIYTVPAGQSESASLIKACGISVLVCPGSADVSLLPENMLGADFVVTDTEADFTDKISPVCTVVSAGKDDIEKNIAAFNGLNCVCTGGDGSVVLQLSGAGKLSLRREDNA